MGSVQSTEIMPKYTQVHRQLAITTPLGKDILLLIGFHGHEAISQLFSLQLDFLSELENRIQFERLIGQNVTIEMRLANEEKRYFNGIIKRLSEGGRDERFNHFRAELVPKLWLLTKHSRCRIFQHLSIPDILRQVLVGLDVSYDLSATYHQRDYCVQYNETDFDFASRLMEEEGIYYFFKHADGNHQLVVTDVPTQHPSVPGTSNVIYDAMSGGERDEMRISRWEKSQELRSGKYTLWDHCFELPGNHLESKKKIVENVTVGEVSHKLTAGNNDQLEIYEYPGGYAQRFDGIDPSGSPRPQELKEITPDSERTVKIRMEEEAAVSIDIAGESNCGQFVSGHTFKVERHFDGNGRYLLTRIEHESRLEGNYLGNEDLEFHYKNRFNCIPVALPYRPQRVTSWPVIPSIQTATVVGPAGSEIFCDKYGRVKVQFHWDREGKKDANSSCWIRVAQAWAGKGWGAFFWPRIGHEVVVVFEDGDPDQPLIVGSVYNAQNMPPFELPKSNMIGGIKSASFHGAPRKNFNGILFVDTKDHEHLVIHSERHMVFNAEFDKEFHAGRNHGERVPGARTITVGAFPHGGGSGGGPNTSTFWPQPDPISIFGVNSTVVYGGNFQVAMPLNYQLALGSNLQICINPAAFATIFPSGTPILPHDAAQVLGSGLGGNMQLTLGTSANFVMGQIFDINVGPRRIQIDADSGTPFQVAALKIGVALSSVIVVFLLAYGLLENDAERAGLLITLQVTTQVLLMALMDFQRLHGQLDDNKHGIYDSIFKTHYREGKADEAWKKFDPGWADVAAVGSVLSLLMLPAVVESLGEHNRDNRS
jgi:type VI secretion system secreted protein VgrG